MTTSKLRESCAFYLLQRIIALEVTRFEVDEDPEESYP